MSLKSLFYAYVLGGLTFLPLVVFGLVFYTIYTSVPVGEARPDRLKPQTLEKETSPADEDTDAPSSSPPPPSELNDTPRVRKGWLTVRRTFEALPTDASYVDMVRGFLIDARSKDPSSRRARARDADMWFGALKGKVLYLYEDEGMTECEAAIELSAREVVVVPEGLPDGELFARRNAICLRPRAKARARDRDGESAAREMQVGEEEGSSGGEDKGGAGGAQQREEGRERALDASTPWFMFVRSAVEMEDWYFALVHASEHPAHSSTLEPLRPVYVPEDMSHLVATLDEQPDVIPMRWLNALLGRIFFSYYRTQTLEAYIIGRLMKKISKVKRPTFLTDIKVREVSVGTKAPTLSKPMLKELTKEGDASLEIHLAYKGEIRITVEATATINLGARFKTYVVKLVLALVVREIEGNLLVKVKRPPSSRIWYAFTQMPKIVMDVEPVVSDRQITWSMITSTIESKVREVINESVVLPNMDDIAFFESSPYQHRGGIWADASRHEQAPTLGEGQPLPSSGAEGANANNTQADAAEARPPPAPRSHSAEEPTASSSQSQGTALPDVSPVARATTVAVVPTASSSDPRRRTWTSNRNGGEDGSSTNTPTVAYPETSLSDEQEVSRGRTLGTDAVAPRRASLPNLDRTDAHSQNGTEEEGQDQDQYLTPSFRGRRSPSQHSRSASSRAASVSSSHAGDISDDASDSQASTSLSRPQSRSGGSSAATSTTTTMGAATFLQTLKSRAGDKQALSNTAKETMRKWGVTWGQFRREAMGSGGSTGGGSAQAEREREEVPDAGLGDARRAESRAAGAVRPSYAEVRAAVEERRERGEYASGASHRAEPIPVGKRRAGSMSVDHALLSGPGTSPAAEGVLERTESHASAASASASQSQMFVIPTAEEDQRPPSTIHTQPPPPKTMSIPGIHARHRGEVMSMGYAPPPPPPAPLETKKAPAPLQSVIRLWKSPGESASAARSESALGAQATAAEGLGEEVVSPRPVPPPLPPRAASTTVISSTAGGGDAGGEVSMSRASAALQSIASKDREKRASVTLTPPSSPGQSGEGDGSGVVDGEAEASPPLGAIGRGPPPALPPRRPRGVS